MNLIFKIWTFVYTFSLEIINYRLLIPLIHAFFKIRYLFENPVLPKIEKLDFSEMEPIKQGLLFGCSISEIAFGRVKCSPREALTVLAI